MAEKKRRASRRAYLDDFTRSVDGQYIYTGKLHHYDTPDLPRKKALGILWAAAGTAFAADLIAGCVRAVGPRTRAYVIVPYAIALIAAGFLLWTTGNAALGGDPMRDYTYKDSVEKFPARAWVAVIAQCAAVLGEVLSLLLHGGEGELGGALAYVGCTALAAAGCFLWKRTALGLHWSE